MMNSSGRLFATILVLTAMSALVLPSCGGSGDNDPFDPGKPTPADTTRTDTIKDPADTTVRDPADIAASKDTTALKDTAASKDTIVVKPDTAHYSNPVWKESTSADPTIIRVGKTFYSYSTGNLIQIIKSDDMVHWTAVSKAFTNDSRPRWIKNGKGEDVGIWAPDVEYIGGQYVLYYGLSGSDTGFGAATSASPEGPFTDRGVVVSGNTLGTAGNVDQFYFKDPVTGIQWMGWGSYGGNKGGFHIAELSDDGLSLKDTSKIYRIAGSAWEGGQMYYHDGTYYLFASGGYCCSGEKSTYNVQVAKGPAPTGPFKNKKGIELQKTAGTWKIMEGNEAFVGPGHVGEIVTDDNGDEWIIYHSYIKGSADKYGRVLCIDRLTWDNEGWPVINGGAGPSTYSKAPYFK